MKNRDTFTTAIQVRLDGELRESLEGLAKADLRSLSNYVRAVLEQHVRQSRKVVSQVEKAKEAA